ncbi:MAG TPA: efflux RND transporter permease subunit [Actinomycetota bacterium]|nr:efflux RND transporter permease subunit [Actinomycetota bacterium]
MKLSDVAIDRPVFTSMVAIAAMVLGGLAVSRLGLDLFPDVAIPVVSIAVPYPGASPEEVESQVTRPIEEAVSGINDVDKVRTYSRDSLSLVVAFFKLSADAQRASNDVRDRMAAIRGGFPRDVRDPVIAREDPRAKPVLTYAVSSPRSSVETRRWIADVIRPALERVDGVGTVSITGGDEREVRVEIDRRKLDAVHLSLVQVAQAVGAESFDVPGGRLSVGSRELALKAAGRFRTPAEVGDVVLAAPSNGSQVRVRDVATIVDGVKEARTLTRVDGVPSVTFEVRKQATANTVAVANAVGAALRSLPGQVPADVKIAKVLDGSQFIRGNFEELRGALVLGALFAVLVIFVFMLDWRSTLISALALPTSVVATFFVMWQLGFSLNVISMLALSLAIGLLIDDSVVVRENIFRHMERGEDPVTAARKGTSEIALAVMATTFTVVAVFGPIAFTGGLVGLMFKEFGLTVAAAVLVSLLVSLTLDPMLSARIVQRISADHHERMREHRLYGPVVRAYDALDGYYRRTLVWALGHRKTVVAVALGMFLASLSLTQVMGTEFFNRGDQGEFTINVELPAGTSLSETDRATRRVEAVLREDPDVATIATTIGPSEEVDKAMVRARARPLAERTRSVGAIMEDLRPRLADIPGLVYSLREADPMGEGSALEEAPVTLLVRGSDYTELARLAREALEIVRSAQGVRDPILSYRPGMRETRLVVDRTRAGDLGVSFAAAAATLRTAVAGEPVAKYRDGENDVDVRVQLRPEDRADMESILALSVPSSRGRLVQLREVTGVDEATMPATIERLDRERHISITANVVGRPLGDVVEELRSRLEQLGRPPGYTFRFAGEAEQMEETFTNMGLALALAVVFIYLVLASQFESLLHPFTIMLSLPLAIVGALVFLFVLGISLDVTAMIGIVLLMGLVTKNAILLVDYTNQLRERGKGIVEAVLEAGPTRLRPILMTSAAMVLGMLPAAVGGGEGQEFRVPMSVSVIGGVVTSTFLTLVVVPVVYVWVDRFTVRAAKGRGRS